MYLEHIYNKFKDLEFKLVSFDNGSTDLCMSCYLLASGLNEDHLKNKWITALDLGNYIYKRFGYIYESGPEYGRSGEPENSLAFYQSKKFFNAESNSHIREWILKHKNGSKRPDLVLYEKRYLDIPHIPLYKEYIAIWKKTGEIVILRIAETIRVIFECNGREFIHPQIELGPESDFEILYEL